MRRSRYALGACAARRWPRRPSAARAGRRAACSTTSRTSRAWSASPPTASQLRALRDGAGRARQGAAPRLRLQARPGYAVARRDCRSTCRRTTRSRFRLRGDAPPNDLEFKLVDATGDNVWWVQPARLRVPARVGRACRSRSAQIDVRLGPGGRRRARAAPRSSSRSTAARAARARCGSTSSTLERAAAARRPSAAARRGGAVVARAGARRRAPSTAISATRLAQRRRWRRGAACAHARPRRAARVRRPRDSTGCADRHASRYASSSPTTARPGAPCARVRRRQRRHATASACPRPRRATLRVRLLRRRRRTAYGLAEIDVQPLAFGATPQRLLRGHRARGAARRLPARLLPASRRTGRWSASTAAPREALLGEDGALEVGTARFSIEPFLLADGRLADLGATSTIAAARCRTATCRSRRVDWQRARTSRCASPRSPPGSATRSHARGRATASRNLARERAGVHALPRAAAVPGEPAQRSSSTRRAASAPIRDAALATATHSVDQRRSAGASRSTRRTASALAASTRGDVAELLRSERRRRRARSSDATGFASAALRYRLDAAGPAKPRRIGSSRRSRARRRCRLATRPTPARTREQAATRRVARRSTRVALQLRPAAAQASARHAAHRRSAHILDQPRRPRDPARLARLRALVDPRRRADLGGAAAARPRATSRASSSTGSRRTSIADGKVPCCVDRRGADPVPEHDSHGEFIYLVAEYYRYTGDDRAASRPHVAARRGGRRLPRLAAPRAADGPEYDAPERRAFLRAAAAVDQPRGLLGQADALVLGRLLRAARPAGRRVPGRVARLGHEARTTRSGDRATSSRATSPRRSAPRCASTRIDYVPGCADSATSTPPRRRSRCRPRGCRPRCREPARADVRALLARVRQAPRRRAHRGPTLELRSVGAFVRLGWPSGARTPRLLRRPAPARVAAVGRGGGPRRAGAALHRRHAAWVGSDFRARCSTCSPTSARATRRWCSPAGLPTDWLAGGHRRRDLRTPYGKLTYTLSRGGAAPFDPDDRLAG